MYPFPTASDLQFLVGKSLEHVRLGFWQFEFVFEKGSINVEGEFEHVDSQGVVRGHNTGVNRLAPIYVHHIPGQTVTTVSVEPFCLTLAFGRGDLLRIYSNEGQFACGQIYDDEGRLIPF